MNLYTISEIEKVKSVSSPHEEELKHFGENWKSKFRELGEEKIEKVTELVRGRKEFLDLDEEWTLTKEFYPGVNVHLSYHYHGDEFSEFGEEDSVKFLFSGNRVKKVTGEDLAGMIEVMLNFLKRFLEDKNLRKDEAWRMKKKYTESRKKPFEYLAETRGVEELSEFMGGRLEKKKSEHILRKEIFKGVEAEIGINENFSIDFSGKNLNKLSAHDLDSLSVFLLNHMIRFIAMKYEGRDLPSICQKVFP